MQPGYTQKSGHLVQRKSSLGEDDLHIQCEDQRMEEDFVDPALKLIVADDGSVGNDSMNSSEENDVIDDKDLGVQIKIADLTVFR